MSASVEDYKKRKSGRPSLGPPEAGKLLLDLWGLEASQVQALDSYDDANFRIDVKGGKVVLLKVHNEVDSGLSSLLEAQVKLLLALSPSESTAAAGISTPVPQASKSGRFVEVVEHLSVASGCKVPLAVRVNTFVEGQVMRHSDAENAPLLEKLGTVIARLSEGMNGGRPAACDLGGEDSALNRGPSHVWDLARVADLAPYAEQYVQDPARRAIILDVVGTFCKDVLPSSDSFRKGVVHGDLNDANILVSEDRREVVGIIDFGDASWSWLVAEIAVAMAYVMVDSSVDKAIGSAAVLLRGFVAAAGAPLPPCESRHLRTLVAARLAQSAALGSFAVAMEPSNAEYLQKHSEPAWQMLQLLWEEVPETHTRALWEKAIMGVEMQDLLKVSGTKRRATKGAPPPSKPRLTFVTGNGNKLREVAAMMGGEECPVELLHRSADLPELQGEPLDICRQKCVIAARRLKGPVIVEDTGLCFNALGGLPGPYIKHFLERTGHAGLNNLLSAYQDKSAYAQCIFGFCAGPDEEVRLFEGRAAGRIVEARGDPNAFGWDPVFEPEEGEGGRTFAEMSKEAKNRISHRSKALEKLRAFLSHRYP